MSLNPSIKFASTQQVSQVIRCKTLNELDIKHAAKEDLKCTLANDTQNNFDFYDVQTNVKLPRKLIPKNFPQTYKSIHRLVECKAKDRLVEVFQDKEYNEMQKSALNDLRKEGKYTLLSDVYKEFSKDGLKPKTEQQPDAIVAAAKQQKKMEKKQVEDLDGWTQEKIHGERIKHEKEIEELRNEVMRMIQFVDEGLVNSGDQAAVQNMFEDLASKVTSQSRLIKNFEGTYRSPFQSTSGGTELPPIKRSAGKHLSKTPKASSSKWSNDEMQGFGRFTDHVNSTHENINIRSRLNYYKGMHEQTENLLNGHIRHIESEIEKRSNNIEKIVKENEVLSHKLKQAIADIESHKEKMEQLKNGSKSDLTRPIGQGLSLVMDFNIKDEIKRRDQENKERAESLKHAFEDIKRALNFNEEEKKRLEGEIMSLSKKLKLFKKIKTKLGLKILKHGFDCREEGLIWVLKDLIKDGQNITYDDFPEFLDQGSRAHLLQKGKLMNELRELKAKEKSLIMTYKTTFEGKLNLESNVISQVFAEENGSRLMKSVSLQSKLSKSKTLSKIEHSSRTLTNLEPIQSLNDLGLDLDDDEREETQKSMKRSNKATTVNYIKSPKHSESVSFAKSIVFGSPEKPEKPKNLIQASLTEINSSRRNINEQAYNDGRLFASQIVRKPDEEKPQKKVVFNDTHELLKGSIKSKEEYLAKVQEVQAKISAIMAKIHEQDQKEGVRIVNEHDPNRLKVDLEFYLVCVIGLAQGERFYYRFCLKKL